MFVPECQWPRLFLRDRVPWRHLFRFLLVLALIETVWFLSTRIEPTTSIGLLTSGPTISSLRSRHEPTSLNPNDPAWLRVKRTHLQRMVSYDQLCTGRVRFRPAEEDVMVFLHLQKTSGSEFGRQLVERLQMKAPCQCGNGRNQRLLRCHCPRPASETLGIRDRPPTDTWLFSSVSVGWRCGVHATWTELVSCVPTELDKLSHRHHQQQRWSNSAVNRGDRRRYFYITWLRDPVQRALSEWQHVARGATWARARHWCQGRRASEALLQPCYTADSWVDVSLDEFLACETNLAHNRQTLMLADLDLVHCYNRSALSTEERERRLLNSARDNLRAMAFFGVTELQSLSQRVFEHAFQLRFDAPFEQRDNHARYATGTLTDRQLKLLHQRNKLDLQLYEFGRELLEQRGRAVVREKGDTQLQKEREEGDTRL